MESGRLRICGEEDAVSLEDLQRLLPIFCHQISTTFNAQQNPKGCAVRLVRNQRTAIFRIDQHPVDLEILAAA